ncbi:MAG: response regulator [Pseudomonadota bacterium]
MEKLDYSNKTCLVVEDRRPFMLLLKGLLANLGAGKVISEQSAEAALRTCRVQKIDIIVCDLHLGVNRKNGFEFLEEVRKDKIIKPSTVFIMISGESSRSMVLGSIEKQPDDYLVKPFSQAQLNARIARATMRRTTLSALYSQIDHNKLDLAIQTCKHYLETEPRYTSQLLKYLVQLYWKTKKYSAAEQLLQQILDERPMHWAAVAMAKTKFLLGNYEEAIDLGKKVIEQSRNTVEAYDIVADALLMSDKKSDALKYIQEALSLSPLSIDRHFKVCKISRENENYDIAMTSARSIYELSQRSVHKNVNHMCSYIRSILDVAENSGEKKDKNRFLQEALLTMQRAQTNESANGKDEGFNFGLFESLVQARMQFIEGKTTEAKRSLENVQIEIEQEFAEYPLSMAPDSLKLMLDLGDFEEATKLSKLLGENIDMLDPSIAHQVELVMKNNAEKRQDYILHNKKGIEHYSKGSFHQAYEEFINAKNISPLNIGVNLNLLQSLVKLIKSTKGANSAFLDEAKSVYRFIENMPLKATHMKKFANMQGEVKEAIT